MSDQIKPPKRKHALNNPKLRLSAPNTKGGYASLSWDLYQNNPRIVVDMKDPSLASPENGYGRITAAMDMPTFGVILTYLQQAIDSKEPVKFKIENWGHDYVDGKRNMEATLSSDTWVGRDAEGQIFLSIVTKKHSNWPVVKFVFGPADNRYHKFFNADGSAPSKAELSVIHAKSYALMLPLLMASVADTHYYDAPPPQGGWGNKGGGGGNRQWGNKGGQGGGGNYGGGGGGGNRPQQQAPAKSDNDDDIPW